jgi:hypothetical protein
MPYPEPDEDRVIAQLDAILSELRAMNARQADSIDLQRKAIEAHQQATRRASRILTSLIVALTVVILAAYFGPYVSLWLVHR